MSNSNDFVIERNVLKKYNGPGGYVVVPDSVTESGECAFNGCTSLVDITVPNSGTYINQRAFNGCDNLKIHASAGSLAEKYAKENNISFIAK